MADTDDPAWTDELLRDPHAVGDKRRRVRDMFAAIAPKYDLNNRLHSLGQDQRWRRRAVRLAEVRPSDVVVDVACGTGDLTIAFANALVWREQATRPTHQIVGIDFTYQMLPLAREKWASDGLLFSRSTDPGVDPAIYRSVQWLQGDATALPLPDACCDVVSIAFGLRNVQEPAAALAEFFRVLRPGGRVIVLEFSRPKNRLIRFLNDLYCARIMPHTATWISGDRSGAYKYLPMSVKTFADPPTMTAMLATAGFERVTHHPMTFGVAVVYRGYKR